ncbi:MAG: hypothetical protein WDW36_001693 [Sanguina aurantia]
MPLLGSTPTRSYSPSVSPPPASTATPALHPYTRHSSTSATAHPGYAPYPASSLPSHQAPPPTSAAAAAAAATTQSSQPLTSHAGPTSTSHEETSRSHSAADTSSSSNSNGSSSLHSPTLAPSHTATAALSTTPPSTTPLPSASAPSTSASPSVAAAAAAAAMPSELSSTQNGLVRSASNTLSALAPPQPHPPTSSGAGGGLLSGGASADGEGLGCGSRAGGGVGGRHFHGTNPNNSSNEDLRRGFTDMKQAYDEMRGLLKNSMEQCMKLSDDVVRLDHQARQSATALADSTAAARSSKKEAADAAAAVAVARREAVASEKTMTQLKAELEAAKATREEADGLAELEVLRSELASAVRKATAAVGAREAAEARVAMSEAAAAAAVAGKEEADDLRREVQLEAHAAIAAAEHERGSRAEAEGLSETLKSDGDRRVRVFHAAVRAAVGRIQKELESDRDELQAQLRDLGMVLLDTKAELQLALEEADAAAREAADRTRDAHAAGHLAATAQAAVERSQARELEAAAAAAAAEAARQLAVAEVAGLREERGQAFEEAQQAATTAESLKAELEAASEENSERVRALEREVRRHADRAEAAAQALGGSERQLEATDAAGRKSASGAAAAAAASRRRVEELEAEVAALKASSHVMGMFQLPSKEDVLAGLGLEVWKDDRLRWKNQAAASATDLESRSPAPPPRHTLRSATAGFSERAAASLGSVRGTISLRVWLVVAYLSLLHILVMVSFTHNHSINLKTVCAAFVSESTRPENLKELP